MADLPLIRRASFTELDVRTLYDILRLRSEVFVVEQACAYLDPDGRDVEPEAEHLWATVGSEVVAAIRLLQDGDDTWSIGRVVTHPDHRGHGVAANLLRAGVDRLRDLDCGRVLLHAQRHLVPWYRSLEFTPTGHVYIEDGIEHETMERVLR